MKKHMYYINAYYVHNQCCYIIFELHNISVNSVNTAFDGCARIECYRHATLAVPFFAVAV